MVCIEIGTSLGVLVIFLMLENTFINKRIFMDLNQESSLKNGVAISEVP